MSECAGWVSPLSTSSIDLGFSIARASQRGARLAGQRSADDSDADPRSLALTLFRNLNISTLDEMPPGRTPVATELFRNEAIATVDALVRAQLEKGSSWLLRVAAYRRRGGESGFRNRCSETARNGGAQTIFGIGTLHGRLRPAEKDRVMRAFRDGVLDVLVSTTVVEVGIDVPEGDDYSGRRGGALWTGAITSIARTGGAGCDTVALLPGGFCRRECACAGAARGVDANQQRCGGCAPGFAHARAGRSVRRAPDRGIAAAFRRLYPRSQAH